MTNASMNVHLEYLNQRELSFFFLFLSLEKEDYNLVIGNTSNAK